MKQLLKGIFLIALIVFPVSGCRKNNLISDKQAILFQFEYLNYAWGFQQNGFLIDNEGNVLTYNNPENWNFADNDFMITESQVTENINKCLVTRKKISKEELQKYSNHIRNIASSKITALKNVAADEGSFKFICYQFSESTGIYKGTIIKMEGDFTCENLNFYSKKVVAWLKDINKEIAAK
jgi:predicted secreted protein